MDEVPRFSIVTFVAACAGVSSLVSINGQLAEGRPIALTTILGAVLWSGLAATAIGALLAPYLDADLLRLLLASTLAGIGAANLGELLYLGLHRFVVFIVRLIR
jgi:hypothetical protein